MVNNAYIDGGENPVELTEVCCWHSNSCGEGGGFARWPEVSGIYHLSVCTVTVNLKRPIYRLVP